MINPSESLSDQTERDFLLLTAEGYLGSIGQDDPQAAERRSYVEGRDLESEIDGQVAEIDGLIEEWKITGDPALEPRIEDAKISLGNMLVDKNKLSSA